MIAADNTWSRHAAPQRAWRLDDRDTWASAKLSLAIHPAGNNPPHDNRQTCQEDMEQGTRFFQRPTTGRTGRIGRRVERPGHGETPGPSGQTDGTRDLKHANK